MLSAKQLTVVVEAKNSLMQLTSAYLLESWRLYLAPMVRESRLY